jgi:hypothetical protein
MQRRRCSGLCDGGLLGGRRASPRKRSLRRARTPAGGYPGRRLVVEVCVYPRVFDYVAPGSRDEVLDILAERGSDVKILAGGQSLIPMMKLRFASPETLVDINRLPGLDYIERRTGISASGRSCATTAS